MTRGNQREKAREKNLKAQAAQKNKTGLSGSKMAEAKLKNDNIMMEKQRKAEEKKAAQAAEEAQKKVEAEAKKKADALAKKAADAEARKKAEEEAKQNTEAQAEA